MNIKDLPNHELVAELVELLNESYLTKNQQELIKEACNRLIPHKLLDEFNNK